jgi:hypothetical protein
MARGQGVKVLLNIWVLHNYVLTLLYSVIYGEMWLQFVELCSLSDPDYHEFAEGFVHKYGTIARLWIGPYLVVFLTEANVEVSKVALAL